ncbi:MAG: type II toxin-antitoxin system RelE/ParE family toxin [Rhodospirillales bacterium]|nr:type II toxin-antitoxin system RelE/ParE family toxin [Rhodospirillales bacterium]
MSTLTSKKRNPAGALVVARTIRAVAERLTVHPMLGRPGRVKGTRELALTGYPYVIAYRVTREAVELLAVRHMARRWP